MGLGIVNFTSAGTVAPNAAVTTTAMDTTGANLLVVVAINLAANAAAAISDSEGNSWTALTRSPVVGGGAVQILYSAGTPTTDAAHTVTIGADTNNLASLHFIAACGAATSPFSDEAITATGTTGTVTTTVDGELFIGGYQDSSAVGVVGGVSPSLFIGAFAVIGGTRFASACYAGFLQSGLNYTVVFNHVAGGLNPTTAAATFLPDTSSGGSVHAAVF